MINSKLIEIFKAGGIVAYPTEAMYGLGCDPDNPEALQRLIDLKQRDSTKGMLVIAANYNQLLPYIDESKLTNEQIQNIQSKWPGQHTWVLPKSNIVEPLLSGQFNTIAARVPNMESVIELCQFLGKPIVSTSANISGQAPCLTAEEVKEAFAESVDFILDKPIGGAVSASPIFDAITGKQYR